jgi:TRAP-type C4-dicarboxylate transport system permease small subunit
MIGVLKKASDGAYLIGKWITFFYITSVTVLSILGVFFRIFGNALSWNEELMRWLLISLAYVGASVAMKTRNHIGIEFFIMRANTKLRKILILMGYAAIFIFLIIVLVYGFQTSLNARRQYGAILRVPMLYVKMNLPLGSLLMLIHMTYFSVCLFREKDDFRKYMISGGEGSME